MIEVMKTPLPSPTVVAADIMTRKPEIVNSSSTIASVAKLFLDHSYSSAPVIGSGGEVLGIIDEFALIKIKLQQHLAGDDRDVLAHHQDTFSAPHFVSENTPLIDLVKEMLVATNHRLLVLNKAKNLMGIISPKDVLRYVVGEKEKVKSVKVQLEETKTSLDKTLKELKKTKSKLEIYKDMVMDSPTMIHSVDANGKIIMANRKMHTLLGYKGHELIGKTIYDLYAEATHADASAGLKKIIESGFHQNTFSTMLKKDGEKVRVDVASAALQDESGNFLATITVSRPVDADILLRALHGVLSKDSIGAEQYSEIKNQIEKSQK